MSPCKNLLQSSENSSFLVFEHQRSTKVEKRPDVWSSAILANLISYPSLQKICEKMWLSNKKCELWNYLHYQNLIKIGICIFLIARNTTWSRYIHWSIVHMLDSQAWIPGFTHRLASQACFSGLTLKIDSQAWLLGLTLSLDWAIELSWLILKF